MSQAIATTDSITLPGLVDRASSALAGARTAAEVLEARDLASVAYDAAKKAARLLKAKKAHDELVGAAYRAQADATEIEARAKRRIADEYDAAQERGEVASGRPKSIPDENSFQPTASDLGINSKDIHEARIIRDAEEADPGVVRRALDEAVDAGEEPTKAVVMRAVLKASSRKSRPRGSRFEAPEDSQHDRDLRMLLSVWEAACDSARAEFLSTVNQG